MQLELIIALAIVVPVILFPAAFVWYLNIGGIVRAAREARSAGEKKVAAAKTTS